MREMLCGVEIEAGVHCDGGFLAGLSPVNQKEYLEIILGQITHILPKEDFVLLPIFSTGYPFMRSGMELLPHATEFWTRGGMRCYLDSTIEFATAECGRFSDLVFQKNVVMRLALAMILRARETFAGGPCRYTGPLEILFDNIAFDSSQANASGHAETTHGFHENYLIRRDTFPAASSRPPSIFQHIFRCLGAFWSALPVLGGSGHIGPTGTFFLSPRTNHVAVGIGNNTTSSRTMVNTRDEPHADQSKFLRYHHVGGDTNITDNIFEMKIAFTYWALRLLERGWTPPEWLCVPDKGLQEITRKVNCDPSMTVTFEHAGYQFSAIDILETYLTAVDAWRGELMFDDEDAAIFLRIGNYIEKARRGPKALVGISEWATKHDMFCSRAEKWRIPSFNDDRLRMISIGLHNIDPDPLCNPFARLRASALPPNRGIGDLVKAARIAPRTRAFIRGLAIFLAKKLGISITLGGSGWDQIYFLENARGAQAHFKISEVAPWELTKENISRMVCEIMRRASSQK